MELTPSQKRSVQRQFDSYCKKVLREEARDYRRYILRRTKNEVPLSILSEAQIHHAYILDEDPFGFVQFHVLGYSLDIHDDRLVRALSSLPDKKRTIILLSYFLDMTDQEIADRLNTFRSTVQYQRISSLRKMKQELEAGNGEYESKA